MNWVRILLKTIDYIEKHLKDEINIEEIWRQAYTTSSHFQGFYAVSRRAILPVKAVMSIASLNATIVGVLPKKTQTAA